MIAASVAGWLLLLLILWDGFETVLLPRRVTRKVRLSRLFYQVTWRGWSGIFAHMSNRKRREQALSAYGPLSILVLMILWAAGLILGFTLIHWGRQSSLFLQHEEPLTFLTYAYMSGTMFFTLGLGDIVPLDAFARVLTLAEAGTGFGFLGIVIGYLPVLYGGFSEREANVALLDARAGTPPAAIELLRRASRTQCVGSLDRLFVDWERWAADLLERHISYPVLSYYRSQHDNQSWLAALTVMLDTCSLVLAGVEGVPRWQAQLTFAMARHAAVDLAQIHNTPPLAPVHDRLGTEDLERARRTLQAAGIPLPTQAEFEVKLTELRRLYEPYVNALAHYLAVPLPAWQRHGDPPDNWQTSAWERRATGRTARGIFDTLEDDHEG
jgi:hypothetical protein